MTRIAALRARPLSVALHTPFVTALHRTSRVDTVVVTVTDTDGVTGWGEAPQSWRITGESQAGAIACVEGPLRAALVGQPADPRHAARLLPAAVASNPGARGAVDVALHDLAARRSGLPLSSYLARLAGPGHAGADLAGLGVATDVTLAAGEAGELARAAAARVGEGFTTLKLKVGADAATDAARVLAVRAAVGPEVSLRLDANQGWDAHQAVRVVRELEDAGADVALVEQPVPARDLLALAHVTAHVATPVMADEALFDLDDLVALLRLRACDQVNVKLAKAGGLTPALELLAVASRHGVATMVGSMLESHLGVGAAASLAVAAGTTLLPDLDAAWWAVSSPYQGGPRVEGALLRLPDAPGLGVTGLRDQAAC